MYKKHIVYKSFDDAQLERDFFFNLTKTELLGLEIKIDGGLARLLTNIVETKDAPKLFDLFQQLIAASYGVKSPNGERFMKSPEILREFTETNAYSELYMELVSDDKAAAAFANGIMPPEMLKAAEEEMVKKAAEEAKAAKAKLALVDNAQQ